MNVSGRTTVSKLKTMFREEFGIGVRIYNGKRVAEDSATLASIRNGGDARKSDFELRGNMKVGNAERLFKDVFGITIQIEDRAGKLADNSVTISSLKTAKDIKADKAAATKAPVPDLKEGGYFKFGSYYQENSSEKTPIEWLVLKKSGSKMLLISRYCLDCKEYHQCFEDITWEKCDLRDWLNGEFLETAFTVNEREKIEVTKLANDDNAKFCTIGGNGTQDRVFCLSLAEAESLFKDDEARRCVPTQFALEEGVYENEDCDDDELIEGRACCSWWLRSPGESQDSASTVFPRGARDLNGNCICCDDCAVRPALWVNL